MCQTACKTARTLLKRTVALLLLLILTASLGEAKDEVKDAFNGTANNVAEQSLKLQGGLKMSEKIMPVPLNLKSGSSFYSALLNDHYEEDEWIKLPSWRAGIFERHTTTRQQKSENHISHVFKSKYVTPEQVLQKDRNGGIWQYLTAPEHQSIDLGDYLQYSKITDNEIIESTEKEELMRTKFLSLKVDKTSGKIVEVFQQEQMDYLTPLKKGKGFHQDSYVKWFSETGQASSKPTDEMSADMILIKPYRLSKSYKGKDMRASLREYLKNHNLEELIPIY